MPDGKKLVCRSLAHSFVRLFSQWTSACQTLRRGHRLDATAAAAASSIVCVCVLQTMRGADSSTLSAQLSVGLAHRIATACLPMPTRRPCGAQNRRNVTPDSDGAVDSDGHLRIRGEGSWPSLFFFRPSFPPHTATIALRLVIVVGVLTTV